MRRSRYDDLHDHYERLLTTKAGTRYERLAAVVFAAMERDGVVIHDLVVRGAISDVGHQIDVQIVKNGAPRRVLVECKDFDVSGDPVGLDIVRSFSAVVADARPDEAWIITCNDFTKDARKFAKAMGIRLATLRAFRAADWENRVHIIVVNVAIQTIDVEHPTITLKMDDADVNKLKAEAGTAGPLAVTPEDDPTLVFDGNATRPLSAMIVDVASRIPLGFDSAHYAEGVEFDGWISGSAGRRYPLQGIRIEIPVMLDRMDIRITAAQEAARLLLTDSEGVDFVLWEDALQGFSIDESGEVHLSDAATQKRLSTSFQRL